MLEISRMVVVILEPILNAMITIIVTVLTSPARVYLNPKHCWGLEILYKFTDATPDAQALDTKS